MFRAEFIKLKRSSAWLVGVILPLLAVTTGTINLANNRDVLDAGWASFTSQVLLFYGLLFFSTGIALLASTVWRMEHRGSNWNLLLATTAQPFRLVCAKVCIIVVMVVIMQLVLVAGTLASGFWILRLDGAIPWEFVLAAGLAVVCSLPLVAIQSGLSMLMKSFAAPVALCMLGCVVSIASVTSAPLRPISFLLPAAINTRTLNLGSGSAIAEAGSFSTGEMLALLLTAFVQTTVFVLASTAAVREIKMR